MWCLKSHRCSITGPGAPRRLFGLVSAAMDIQLSFTTRSANALNAGPMGTNHRSGRFQRGDVFGPEGAAPIHLRSAKPIHARPPGGGRRCSTTSPPAPCGIRTARVDRRCSATHHQGARTPLSSALRKGPWAAVAGSISALIRPPAAGDGIHLRTLSDRNRLPEAVRRCGGSAHERRPGHAEATKRMVQRRGHLRQQASDRCRGQRSQLDHLRRCPMCSFRSTTSVVSVRAHAADQAELTVDPERFVGKSIEEVLSPQRVAAYRASIARAIVGEAAGARICGARPQRRAIQDRGARLGLPAGAITIVRRITERKRAERALRESELLAIRPRQAQATGGTGTRRATRYLFTAMVRDARLRARWRGNPV